jgi:hypothetical protein
MPERSVPDPTKLHDIPKRFWTLEVAKVALGQGHHRLALKMVETLLPRAPADETDELHRLLADAREGIEVEERRRKYQTVIQRLSRCLMRVREMKNARAPDTVRGNEALDAHSPAINPG